MARKKNSKLASAAKALGAYGGTSKGGHARAKKLTPGDRSKIASMGGKAKARKKK